MTEGNILKKLIVMALSICLVFALSACGTKEAAQPAATNGAAPSTSAPTAATPAPASSSAQQLKLTATNFKFDQAEYKVKKDQDVVITLDSKEGMHGVGIDAFKVKLDGTTKTATFKPDKAGTYDIICVVPCGPGHMTMKSKLIVE
jgi:cytochrome c oxidase subunit 2